MPEPASLPWQLRDRDGNLVAAFAERQVADACRLWCQPIGGGWVVVHMEQAKVAQGTS
jgi:hypothetical protein